MSHKKKEKNQTMFGWLLKPWTKANEERAREMEDYDY